MEGPCLGHDPQPPRQRISGGNQSAPLTAQETAPAICFNHWQDHSLLIPYALREVRSGIRAKSQCGKRKWVHLYDLQLATL